jgi:hypothetical protein
MTVTGMSPPAVEVTSTSAARYRSSAVRRPSCTGWPAWPASSIIERRVMPCRVPLPGVSQRPSR